MLFSTKRIRIIYCLRINFKINVYYIMKIVAMLMKKITEKSRYILLSLRNSRILQSFLSAPTVFPI